MKMDLIRFLWVMLAVVVATAASGQETVNVYSRGVSAEANLAAIATMSPYGVGGMGFDERYEGLKGSPRLYDTLYHSVLKVKDRSFQILVDADIDVAAGRLLFRSPSTGQLMSVPTEILEEVILYTKDGQHRYYTTRRLTFVKPEKELRFCQILFEGTHIFIKMPVKIFREADYKNSYSSDRRFDEYETKFRYYVSLDDGRLRQVQLSARELSKLFPGEKEKIKEIFSNSSFSDEERVVALLSNL
jgi:hypothetical protein